MRNLPHLLRRGHLPRKGPLPGCARSGRWRAGRRWGACSAGSSGTRHPPLPRGQGAYLAGAARPPGRRRHSRCSSSAGAAGTRSRPGSAPPGRRRGAASAAAAGSGRRGAAGGRPPPLPAGRARSAAGSGAGAARGSLAPVSARRRGARARPASRCRVHARVCVCAGLWTHAHRDTHTISLCISYNPCVRAALEDFPITEKMDTSAHLDKSHTQNTGRGGGGGQLKRQHTV